MRCIGEGLISQKGLDNAGAAVKDCGRVIEMPAVNDGGLLRHDIVWSIRPHEAI